MKKFLLLLLAVVLLISGCEGVQIDENEIITGNGTEKIVKGTDVYTVEGNEVTKNSETLYEFDNIKENKLFALGEYLYLNTEKGAMQLTLDGKKAKKFGSGEVVATGGRWIYYQSSDNKVGNMILYKIDMTDGRQLNLFQDTIVEVKLIEDGVFYFKGESGNEYINELNNDNGYFYHQWLNEDVTE